MRSRTTRRATTIAAMATGALAVGGTGSAMAAPFPISISFTDGTVTAGELPGATNATSGAPASFAGTIESDTFVATFPAGQILLPEATLANVAFGGTYGTGTLAIDATPGTFTGTVSPSPLTMNLTGTVGYMFVATVPDAVGGGGPFKCLATAPETITLSGTPLDLATGAYGAAGSRAAGVLTSASTFAALDLLGRAAEQSFCTQLATKIGPVSRIASSFSGKLTIPGLVPTPTIPPGATPAPATPATPATPALPTAPKATAASPGRLSVSVTRPKAVRRGRSTVTKVVVRNTGAGKARSVTVRLAARGRSVTPRTTTKRYAVIAAGRTRTFRVRLRTKRTSPKRSALKVTVKGAGGLSATRSTTLRLR